MRKVVTLEEGGFLVIVHFEVSSRHLYDSVVNGFVGV